MNTFVFYHKLYKIDKLIKKNDKEYHLAVEKEKKGANSPEALQELNADFGSNYFELESKKRYLITSYLTEKAYKLLLPISSRSDKKYWEDYDYGLNKILTEEGVSYLRSLVRKEEKERREAFGYWAVLITGIIGALTGLFAILLK